MGSDIGKNMLVAALDQDYAAFVEHYTNNLDPDERKELAEWIIGKRGSVSDAPDWVREAILSLAALAFMEVGYRYGIQQKDTP